MQSKREIGDSVTAAIRDVARREVENYFDTQFEAHTATRGAFAPQSLDLLVADDWIDELARYLELPGAVHKQHKGAAWRETTGKARGVKIRLSTAAVRFMGAA